MKCATGLAFVLLVLGRPARGDVPDSGKDSDSQVDRAFQSCAFDIDLTSHVKTKIVDGHSWRSSSPGYCSVVLGVRYRLDDENDVTFGGSGVSLDVERLPKDVDQFMRDNWFSQSKHRKWKFRGEPFLSGPRFGRLSTEEMQEKDGMTLVGRARQTGDTPKGAELTVESAYILRIAADFVVKVSISLEPYYFPTSKSNRLAKVPKNKSDQIIADLVKIVRSVRIAPE